MTDAEDRAPERFLPAAGRAPLAFYDAALALGMRERTFRERLHSQVLSDGEKLEVLDVGCGTGTLAIALAAAGASVSAVDPDPDALARARAKPGAERVRWSRGYAVALEVPTASADRVVLSLVLHHLHDEAKRAALAQARRILRPGGRLHIADWGIPGEPLMAIAFRALQMIDGTVTTASLGAGELPMMLEQAGFGAVVEHDRLRTAFGRLCLSSAERP
jgi:ubiquinone/menaquinone biosynthesis C-methylase UbiE